MDLALTIFVLTLLGGLFMAFNNGANDVSNAFATAVGSRALSPHGALWIGGAMTAIGAMLLGGNVALRLIQGIVHPDLFNDPIRYALAMFVVLLSSGSFVFLSTLTRMPVSSTHSLVGSLTGVSIAIAGWQAIDWPQLGRVALSWVVSPILAALATWVLVKIIKIWVLGRNQRGQGKRFSQRLPIVMAIITAAITSTILGYTQLEPFRDLHCATLMAIGLTCGVFTYALSKTIIRRALKSKKKRRKGVTNAIRHFQIASASAVAFGNGANDVSNSISPILAVYLMLTQGHLPPLGNQLPLWILGLGAGGIVLGILTMGQRVIQTLGEGITALTPVRALSADLSVASVVIGASALGLPISTTHAATGAIVGAGLSSGLGGIRFGILGKIFVAWIITVPAAALITVGLYALLERALLH
ncbi:MAG: hypothetical protein B7X06_03210 [Verrucomicrobia bacterium 21-51-4]|nr:MAG: hypothetical protein B7X06_03210 [Verrucomicrobia bacterium 21-51-4]HQU09597.1 inorganic phosphate transporter [Opitutales bacterium]